MSFANTSRSSLPAGGILCQPASAKYSGTSAPVVPPRSARGSNNATTVITNTPSFTRAVIDTAQSASPRLVIDGWREPPENFSLFPTAMLSSRFRVASLRWFFRTQRGCTCTTGDPNRWSPQHSEQQDIHLGAIHRQSLSQISDHFRWSDVPGKLGCPPVSRSA